MPSVMKPPPKTGERKKRKKKRKKIVMRQLKLKGLWLKTPEDWAYFMEWAQKNAVPRKSPPPEPINRGPKKRLSKLKKRLRTLSQPRIRGTLDCAALPRPILPSTLKAKASKRTKRLARPVLRFEEGCHTWRVKRSALLYEATDAILLLSLPRMRPEPDDCRELGVVSPAAIRRMPTDKDCELSQPKQRSDVECKDREIECVDSELSSWIDFLAIPNYRVLKEMCNVEMANKYKKRFHTEIKGRNKRAYKEQLRKRKKQKVRQRRKKAAAKKKKLEGEKWQKESPKSKSQFSLGESQTDVASDSQREDGASYDDGASTEEAEPLAEEPEESEKAKDDDEECEDDEDYEDDEEEDECMKQRRKEKEAWRYDTSLGCKKLPPEIPQSALNYEATEGIIILAVPKTYPKDLCKDPFKISEGAKNAVASPRVEELAKPKHQCEPVVRPEPREKDEWGRPIFPPREYGKKLPKVKPYKPRECPKKKEAGLGKDEEDEAEEDDEYYEDESESFEGEVSAEATEPGQEKSDSTQPKKRRKMSRAIDPIACAPSIDPLFDPVGARKQLKERERAKKLKEAEKETAEKEKAENEKAEKEKAEADDSKDSNDNEQI